MKHQLTSLRVRLIMPVIVTSLFLVTVLNTVFSYLFIRMTLKQEQEVNAVGFATVSNTVFPLLQTSISEARSLMSDSRVAGCARGQYSSEAELIHARRDCRDFLRSEIASRDRIYGLLFLRKDGSLFGVMPEANLFLDAPEQNPLPEEMKTKILNTPLGETLWVGPVSGEELLGFETAGTPQRIMIAAWKSVDVSYGECCELLLMDESVFDGLFAALRDGKSSWHLFNAQGQEFWHTGKEASADPEQLFRESNSGSIFHDENGLPACAFSMTEDSTAWTVVRKVSMDGYERVANGVRAATALFGGLVLLITLAAYVFWLKAFMRQYNSLQNGIIRIGQGDLESAAFESTSIDEFRQLQEEINRTRLALRAQMDTIRRMEREQMERENERKEQERIAQELEMAREIQAHTLPSIFPAFPERTEFSLYASMTPAKEVGGDFYDFFMIDNDHLALVIADVSGKGIPAALFMMASKTLINNHLMICGDPAEALERVNLQLCENNPSMMFVTVWLAVLEVSTGRGLAVNAGHEHPGLWREGGQFELLRYRHHMFVGVSRKARYVNRPFQLNPGDSLFVYTDGVPEAHNPEGEMFGSERLEKALNREGSAGPKALIDHVLAALDGFVQDGAQFDDVTMLALKYFGTGKGAEEAEPLKEAEEGEPFEDAKEGEGQ